MKIEVELAWSDVMQIPKGVEELIGTLVKAIQNILYSNHLQS